MITLTPDPLDSTKLVLTATATVFIDRLLVETLSSELTEAIRAQAVRDLQGNKGVRKAIAEAATAKLLAMLDVKEPDAKPTL